MNLDKKNMAFPEFFWIFGGKAGEGARFFLPSNLIHFEIAKSSPWDRSIARECVWAVGSTSQWRTTFTTEFTTHASSDEQELLRSADQ